MAISRGPQIWRPSDPGIWISSDLEILRSGDIWRSSDLEILRSGDIWISSDLEILGSWDLRLNDPFWTLFKRV